VKQLLSVDPRVHETVRDTLAIAKNLLVFRGSMTPFVVPGVALLLWIGLRWSSRASA